MHDKIRVAYVGLKLDNPKTLDSFEVHGIENMELNGYVLGIRNLLTGGLSGSNYRRMMLHAHFIDELYRNKDTTYMKAVSNFVEILNDFDVIIFSTFCPIHPEILARKMSGKLKILGFTDDPHSTYARGIPMLWAFDAAYYISPGYSPEMGFSELMDRLGVRARWLPLVQPDEYPVLEESDFATRSTKISYVGCPTGSKIDRMREMKTVFGDDFALYGRWRLGGYYGYIRPLLGEKLFPQRVEAISPEAKRQLYMDTAIGFNMHVSDFPSECGNMRTYETAAYGMMPLCDRGGLNLQTQIFAEGTEAIYYDSIAEAIDLARYYIDHPMERIAIAQAAYTRFRKDYQWEKVTTDFLHWAVSEKKLTSNGKV